MRGLLGLSGSGVGSAAAIAGSGSGAGSDAGSGSGSGTGAGAGSTETASATGSTGASGNRFRLFLSARAGALWLLGRGFFSGLGSLNRLCLGLFCHFSWRLGIRLLTTGPLALWLFRRFFRSFNGRGFAICFVYSLNRSFLTLGRLLTTLFPLALAALTPTTPATTTLALGPIFIVPGRFVGCLSFRCRRSLWYFGFIRFFGRDFFVKIGHQGRINRNHMRHRFDTAGRSLELFNRKVGRNHEWIGFKAHGHAITRFDLCDVFALHVHQEVDDRHRCFDQNLARTASDALFLNLAQDGQTDVVIRPDKPRTVTRMYKAV